MNYKTMQFHILPLIIGNSNVVAFHASTFVKYVPNLIFHYVLLYITSNGLLAFITTSACCNHKAY
jgi:hypothetical protein